METKIVWTEKAILSYELILDFLAITWTESIIDDFKKLVHEKLNLILKNPNSFPKNENHRFARKVIIHANVSLFYDFNENTNTITILFVFDNRQNPSHLKW